MKMLGFKVLIIVFISSTLVACMSEIAEVRKITPKSGNFKSELSSAYRDFALYEADQMYDWFDARKFARKALSAYKNQTTPPEDPDNWNLLPTDREVVKDAHVRLNEILSNSSYSLYPYKAASAQVSFDCWLEQLEEGWQLDHIAECKKKFDLAIQSFEELKETNKEISTSITSVVSESLKRKEICIKEGKISDKKSLFTLHFPHGLAGLRDEVQSTLDNSINYIDSGKAYTIMVSGHTDRSGSDDLNLNLSFQRAYNVWQYLIGLGASPKNIWISAHGELSAKFSIRDGQREERDRRAIVEIKLMEGDGIKNKVKCEDYAVNGVE